MPTLVSLPVVLVTGFLGAPAANGTLLKDETLRFDATCSAIRWLRATSKELRIFLAFTGDHNALHRLVQECDWPIGDAVCFPQTPEGFQFGKGLLEQQLISRALENWQLKQVNARVLKLTAKYTVENLDEVLNFAARSELPFFGWGHVGKRMVDTRCFFFRAQAYEGMLKTLRHVDDRKGYYIEHALYDALSLRGIRPGLLRNRPLLFGLSGSTAEPIKPSIWKRFIVRSASLSGWLPQ